MSTTSPAYSSQRPTTASALAHGEVCRRSTTTALPGAGFSPTPKAKAPDSTWPSTLETARQLTVYTPSGSGSDGVTCERLPVAGHGLRRGHAGHRSTVAVDHADQRELDVRGLGERQHDVPRRARDGGIRGGVGALERRVRGGGDRQGRRARRGHSEQRRRMSAGAPDRLRLTA